MVSMSGKRLMLQNLVDGTADNGTQVRFGINQKKYGEKLLMWYISAATSVLTVTVFRDDAIAYSVTPKAQSWLQ